MSVVFPTSELKPLIATITGRFILFQPLKKVTLKKLIRGRIVLVSGQYADAQFEFNVWVRSRLAALRQSQSFFLSIVTHVHPTKRRQLTGVVLRCAINLILLLLSQNCSNHLFTRDLLGDHPASNPIT
jgi:hypothetical protein